MEKKHKDIIKTNSIGNHMCKIQILNIPDIYKYNDKELIALIDKNTFGLQNTIKNELSLKILYNSALDKSIERSMEKKQKKEKTWKTNY